LLEVARHQAFMHCAVSFQVRDTVSHHMQLMNARAWDRSMPSAVVGEAFAFNSGGFQRGDTVTVVFPNTWCGDIAIGGWGMAAIYPAAGLSRPK
jgi:hypothetical protein